MGFLKTPENSLKFQKTFQYFKNPCKVQQIQKFMKFSKALEKYILEKFCRTQKKKTRKFFLAIMKLNFFVFIEFSRCKYLYMKYDIFLVREFLMFWGLSSLFGLRRFIFAFSTLYSIFFLTPFKIPDRWIYHTTILILGPKFRFGL
jgi:hypothetical protein